MRKKFCSGWCSTGKRRVIEAYCLSLTSSHGYEAGQTLWISAGTRTHLLILRIMRNLSPLSLPGSIGVATTASMREQGVPPWRLYAADVAHPLHGVVAAPGVDPMAYTTKIAALRSVLDDGHFLSRRTAARELDIPLLPGTSAFEVGAIAPRKARRRPGVHGHQLRAGVLRKLPHAPLWLPHPADIWGLLAATSSLDALIVSGDFLISGRNRQARPLTTITDLAETVVRFSRCRGVDQLRAALPLLRTGVESPAESLTRRLISRAGFPEPQTSCPVAVDGRILHADLGYPALKIAIEYDGDYHFTGGTQRAKHDNERIESMIAAGWRVLRLTALDLRDPRRFLARLAQAIERAHQKA